jgi:uncharacterized repeat protein (TIGR01451 family)
MKKFCILIIALLIMNNLKAQTWVTIPDTNFVAWLQDYIPSAMNGNQMDINSPEVTSLNIMNVSNREIADLTGIEYFPSLVFLECNNNKLTSLPSLPSSLSILYCYDNQLTSLPSLPPNLGLLWCSNNELTSIPSLPSNLDVLSCDNNHLTTLPALSPPLRNLNCGNNELTSLAPLPASLTSLSCRANLLSNLPSLNASLRYLICDSNQLTILPALNDSIVYLDCQNNQLTSLPVLPSSLQQIYCGFNLLDSIPALPTPLINLHCEHNYLTSLPSLPAGFADLFCNNNLLTCLPDLPDYMSYLNCANNFINCLPEIPSFYWQVLDLSGNPFTCLPNYVPEMDAALLNYPLCQTGDTINNPNNCSSFDGIIGTIFHDNNMNCTNDTAELKISNIHISIFDSINNLISQTYSLSNGVYFIPVATGKYTVKIDTAGMPFQVQCANPGIDSTLILTNADPTAFDVNFPINCKSGFDIGVQSVVTSGQVFPGQLHRLSITAGDRNQWYHLNCIAGISGQVQVTVTGPLVYQAIVPGSLTPIISGNVFTYSISDFSTIDNSTAFGLVFLTDTTAQSGDEICVHVLITPVAGDNSPSNNTYNYCYEVSNSLDPNQKEVYPVKVLPGYNDYFTYTIHFQNTGTASAINIRIVDTLNSKLDLNTFRVMNYSHENTVLLNGNILTVRFLNIQLPDSLSNPDASKGFFQYCIKPKTNFPQGTQITNTAWIFFDYNSPIATNTATSIFDVTGIPDGNKSFPAFNIYPNPSTNSFILEMPNGIASATIQVYNSLGQLMTTNATGNNAKATIDASQWPAGIYVVRLSDGQGQYITRNIVKQ